MLYYTASKIAGSLRHFCVIIFRVIEEILVLIPKTNVYVHSRTIVKSYGLWHHCCNHVMLFGNVLYDILVALDAVCSIDQCVKTNVYFALTSCRDLVVVSVTHYAKVIGEHIYAFVAIFHQCIAWSTWQIAFLQAESIADAISGPWSFF